MSPSEDGHSAVHDVLARHIRPALSAHTGGIEVVNASGSRIDLRLTGSCRGCYFRRGCVANLVRPTLAEHAPDGYEYNIR